MPKRERSVKEGVINPVLQPIDEYESDGLEKVAPSEEVMNFIRWKIPSPSMSDPKNVRLERDDVRSASMPEKIIRLSGRIRTSSPRTGTVVSDIYFRGSISSIKSGSKNRQQY